MRVRTTLILTLVLIPACSTGTGSDRGATRTVAVVAAENSWGSLAAQLGGDHARVRSIISNPDTDPHDYEATPADGRAVASARYLVHNGLGYDSWAAKLAAANPSSSRRVLDVGALVGKKEGDNPHRWYFPGDVEKVITSITSDYTRLDPADAAYFDRQHAQFEAEGLKRYKDLLAQIKRRYAGTPVGASESIFEGIAEATGLELRTPKSFLDAISEGTDPTAQDKATVDRQLAQKQVKVLVYNSQNATPDVKSLVDQAQAHGIPVTTVTETPPVGTQFQDWQAEQLQSLADALARATGR